MKITEIKGASLLPKYEEITEGIFVLKNIERIGHNKAVTQLEQCSVEVDEQEIATIISNCRDEWGKLPYPLDIAQELSKCKQNWLRLERK